MGLAVAEPQRDCILPLHPVLPTTLPCAFLLPQVAALEDKVAGQQGLAAEQAQRIRDMEVGRG